MDPLVTLKKRLSTYITEGGQLRNVSDEVLFELVTSWELWTGTGVEFYRAIGFSKAQMAGLLGKAKRLKREGHFGSANFKEVIIDGLQEVEVTGRPAPGGLLIELDRGKGVVIRFPHVGQLVEFLKMAG